MLRSLVAFLVLLCPLAASTPLRRDAAATNKLVEDLIRHGSPKREEREKEWRSRNGDMIPNHLNGMRVERNGDFNEEFDSEVFLGAAKDDFKGLPNARGLKKLKSIFNQADQDQDQSISQTELKDWIHQKINEYFQSTHNGNQASFRKFDPNGDGKLTWDEYVRQLRMPPGITRQTFTRVASWFRPYVDKVGTGPPPSSRIPDRDFTDEEHDASQLLSRDKAQWEKADVDNDTVLAVDEFLSFQHPEQSKETLKGFVDDLLTATDQNGDGLLTVQEYVGLDESKDEWSDETEQFAKEREAEFRDLIDLNSDSVVDKDELEYFLDPRSEQYAYNEASHLLSVADKDNDKKLSWDEVKSNYDFFVGSPLVNVSQTFHEEF
ncbi:45 kDa calcium-binding protein-like [Oscarella lobularis]|uniref:45 kDa calcium-binding protein-like n=1 Tax=Oscarella lobularis TaxID=121494 RepID=UPI003313FA4C